MKMTFGKNLDREKIRARAKIDAHFVPLLEDHLGRKHLIYTAKYAAALAFLGGASSTLVSSKNEARAIIAKHAASYEAFAMIEQQRQAAQAEIDACETVNAIDAIILRIIPAAQMTGVDSPQAI